MTIHGASDTSPPTDLELMLYHDGELDEERLASVQAWLEREQGQGTDGADSVDARNKLTSLGLISDVIRDHAREAYAPTRSLTGGQDLADAVMRRIEVGSTSAPITMVGAQGPPQTPPITIGGATPKRAANDNNSRSFYVIASAVVAAAAALMLWARPVAPVHHDEVAQVTAARPATAPDSESDHGVEVAAVDFGTRMGAVFYVPNGTSESGTTTVVWLSDDSAGENQ